MRFIPTKYLKDFLVGIWETLNATTTIDWRLSKAAFTPSLDTILANIVQPTYTGYADVGGAIGAIKNVYDPLASAYLVYVDPVAGPNVYKSTTDTSPAEQIFGWATYVAGPGTIWSSALLDAPIPIAFTADGLLLGIDLFRIADDFLG